MTTRRQTLFGGAAALTAGLSPLRSLATPLTATKLTATKLKLPTRPAITPAPTAVTAFVGRTLWGPAGTPTTLSSYSDYHRIFGPADPRFPLSRAVEDFFLNGGQTAVVLRLAGAAKTAVARLVIGPVRLKAMAPGAWGNDITASVDADTTPGQFVLTVSGLGMTERYKHVGFDGALSLDKQVEASSLVRWDLPLAAAGATPLTGTVQAKGGAGGLALTSADYLGNGAKGGLYGLDAVAFNLLCIPPDQPSGQPGGDTEAAVWQAANAYCVTRRALLIADAPAAWHTAADASSGLVATGLSGASNAALYVPRILVTDTAGALRTVVPCGAIAGIYARTDATLGVWAAPGGTQATLTGVSGLSAALNDSDTNALVQLDINPLRHFTQGNLVYGARTLSFYPEYRYINVLRLGQFIENSVRQGTTWAASAANTAATWGQLQTVVTAFLQTLFQAGAFKGTTPANAFVARCDATTTTAADVQAGRINILIGYATLRPAEFVYLRLTLQHARA